MFADSGVMVDEAIADLHSLDYEKLGAFLSERRLEDEKPMMIGPGSKSEDTSSEVCDYCSRPGHILAECRKQERELDSDGGHMKRNYSVTKEMEDAVSRHDVQSNHLLTEDGPKCFSCQEVGHMKRNCSVTKEAAVSKQGAAVSKQSVQSNHLLLENGPWCNKANSAQIICASRGRSGQGINCCLAHCSRYLAEGEAGKESIGRDYQKFKAFLSEGRLEEGESSEIGSEYSISGIGPEVEASRISLAED